MEMGSLQLLRPIIRLKIASGSMSTHLPLLLHLIQLRQVSLPVPLVRFASESVKLHGKHEMVH